jgi:DNA polymerase-1
MEHTSLLIDARNALYRAIFAVKSDNRHKIKYHYFVAFLRQLTTWVNRYRPDSVHVFWDAPRKEVWRRKILPTYKERPVNNFREDISADLFETTFVAQEIFKYLNVRQFSKKSMEADDLIYAATCVLHPQRTIIISTDSDMTQIPFCFNSSRVYNPVKQLEVEIPSIHPAVQKALVGDKSDCIPGYNGIGPKRSTVLLEDLNAFNSFLNSSGSNIYYRNLLLIDLSLNPKLLHNRIYVQKLLATPTNFDTSKINDLIRKYKINGLLQEFADLVMPFKKLK